MYLDYFNEWEQFSQELRITSQFSDTFEFVAGLYYWDVGYEQFWDVGKLTFLLDAIGAVPNPADFPLNPESLATNGQEQDTTSSAAFISADWHINDQWTITGGARYTREEKEFSGGNGSLYYQGVTPGPISR